MLLLNFWFASDFTNTACWKQFHKPDAGTRFECISLEKVFQLPATACMGIRGRFGAWRLPPLDRQENGKAHPSSSGPLCMPARLSCSTHSTSQDVNLKLLCLKIWRIPWTSYGGLILNTRNNSKDLLMLC
jgi:hypothetical protein